MGLCWHEARQYAQCTTLPPFSVGTAPDDPGIGQCPLASGLSSSIAPRETNEDQLLRGRGGLPRVKGSGVLTGWEPRHTWLRLEENQQAHPETHTHTDRHTHTQGGRPPRPLRTDTQPPARAAHSAPVPAGLALNDSTSVALPRAPGVLTGSQDARLSAPGPLVSTLAAQGAPLPSVWETGGHAVGSENPCRALFISQRGDNDFGLKYEHVCFVFLLPERQGSRTGWAAPPPDLVWCFRCRQDPLGAPRSAN